MGERRAGKPYVWVTYITGLLSGEDHCHWAPWFKARHTYDKVESDFDALEWRRKHTDLLNTRAQQLRADGWQVSVEGQNSMTIRGETATLGCKPDIVAIKPEERRILIVDPKGGKRKDEHWYQVAIYMRWIRAHLGSAFETYSVEGEVFYSDGKPPVLIAWSDLTPPILKAIYNEIQAIGLHFEPDKTPSEQECLYCDIPKTECAVKAAERAAPVTTRDF